MQIRTREGVVDRRQLAILFQQFRKILVNHQAFHVVVFGDFCDGCLNGWVLAGSASWSMMRSLTELVNMAGFSHESIVGLAVINYLWFSIDHKGYTGSVMFYVWCF